MKIEIDELVGIVSKYESSSLTLWNFYIIVILGALGYVVGKKETLEWPLRIIFAATFAVFASGNASYLERNQKLIYSGAMEISKIASQLDSDQISVDMKKGFEEWASLQPRSLRTGHHIIDLVVILLILWGPTVTARVRQSNASPSSS